MSSGVFLNGHNHLPLDTQKSYFLSSKHRQEEFPASPACLMVNAYFLDMYRARSTMSSPGCIPASQLGFAPSVPIMNLNSAFEQTSPREGPGTRQPGVAALLKQLRLTVEPLCPAQLSCLGVDEDSLYRTANSQHLGHKQWKDWIAQRAFVALYIASHRGHSDAVQYLLEHGNSETAAYVHKVGSSAGREDKVACLPGPFSNGVLNPSCVNHQSRSPWATGSLSVGVL